MLRHRSAVIRNCRVIQTLCQNSVTVSIEKRNNLLILLYKIQVTATRRPTLPCSQETGINIVQIARLGPFRPPTPQRAALLLAKWACYEYFIRLGYEVLDTGVC